MAKQNKKPAPETAHPPSPPEPQPTETTDRQTMAVNDESPPKLAFPVVGIGASAGGLEAFSDFITAMRPDSGMAFVFIQHLPPDRESMMAEILSKKTKMLVQQVEEGMPIKPDCVYVIRPGHVLTMKDGVFQLGEQLGRRAAGRPVDDFFKSLAEEQQVRAIGIILSGMGSNGSAGAQAIKAVGGLVIAQDPESAQFPSMPRHLIDQGYADYILRPSDIPEVLLQYAHHPYSREAHKDASEQVRRNENHVREILAILRTRTRQDFNGYKKPTVLRRIQRRMGLTRLTDMGDYAKILRQSPSEVVALADDLLIHVTGFFRDPESWDILRQRVIVPLIARREPESEIRAWVTACASGEEAYSLAMMLVEESEKQNKPLGVKVFATDMAQRPLEHARHGVYPGGIESEIDPERLERFFDKEEGIYRIKPFIRECVVFAPQNVLQDPPFSRLDIISCRNLLIYLEPDVQQRVLTLLHFGLREGGALFLGSSETVSGAEEMYELLDKKARIYRRIGPTRHGALDFPLPHAIRTAAGTGGGTSDPSTALAEQSGELRDRRVNVGRPSIALITQRTLLEQHVRAAVTIDRDFRVVYFHGNVRPFIEQPAGEPTRDLLSLAREGLRGSIRVAVHRASADQSVITVMDGWLEISPGRQVRVGVTASPISHDDPAHSEYFVVSFEQFDDLRAGTEVKTGGNGNAAETATELRRIQDELQTTIEELQTSNEELKASNEEITSINEELQSSNEELETSKEEMQSLNEELTTVNSQLSAKMEELQNASNDLSALLHSTSIAVLFLDPQLRIRKYTPATRDLMELIPSDIGRPLSDMHRKFDDPTLEADARRVLEKLIPQEREVTAENNAVYDRRVLPYRTTDNRIDGVVVTFVDITHRKRAEEEAVSAREYAENIVTTLHEPLVVLNPDLSVRSANQAFYGHFKVKPGDTIGRRIYDLGNGQWNIPGLRKALEEILPSSNIFNDYEVRHDFEDLGKRIVLLNGRRLEHNQLILLGIRDVTREREVADDLRRSEERWKRLLDVGGAGVLVFDIASGVLLDANNAFLEMTGYSRLDIQLRRLTWQTLTPPEFMDESLAQMDQFHKSGRIGPYEKQYFKKDGTRAWMLFSGADVGDGTIVETCIDIDELKRSSLITREAEARVNAIANLVPDLLWSSRADGFTEWYNHRWIEYTGQTIQQAAGSGWTDAVHPEDRAASADRYRDAVQSARTLVQEQRIRRRDGEYRWFLVRAEPVRDARGNLTMFGSATDIHEQRMTLEQLRTGEERFRLLVENVFDYAIFTLDPDGKVASWNPGSQRIFLYSADQIVGQDISVLFTPEDRAKGEHSRELATAARDGRASDDRWQLRSDGTRFWASGVTSAIRDASGELRGYTKVLRDMTDAKRTEQQRERILKRETAGRTSAERAMVMRDEFLAVVSHELRTPLSVILLYAKMLASGKLADKAKDDALGTIVRSAEAQRQLIEDLLDVSRMLSGKLRISLREVELAPILSAATEAVRPMAEVKGVAIDLALDETAGSVRGDPDRIQQIVWNLLNNAVKFTDNGGRVKMTLTRRDGALEIAVTDTGRGIRPDFLPHVFERFRQEDAGTSRPTTGLGLGLAIARQLVELHGGTIRAESRGENQGATFTVTLPKSRSRIRSTPGVRQPLGKAAPETDIASPALSGIRILLVEDDPAMKAAVQLLLTERAAEVVAASSAQEGMTAVVDSLTSGQPFHVIVSDLGMPGTDGYEMMRRIRRLEQKHEQEQAIPAIALSAYARQEDQAKAAAAGFDIHLAKPVEPDVLVEAIIKLLDN